MTLDLIGDSGPSSQQAMVDVTRPVVDAWRILGAIGDALASSPDEQAVAAAVSRAIVPVLADCCIVYLGHDDQRLRPASLSGASAEIEAAIGEAIVGLPSEDAEACPMVLAALERQTIVVGEPTAAANRSLVNGLTPGLRRIGIRSSICVPLQVRGRVLGVLELLARDLSPATPEIIALAEAIGRQTALVMDNARLDAAERASRQQVERTAERARQIQRLTAALAAAVTEEQAVQVSVECVVAAVGATAGAILLLSADRTALELRAAVGCSHPLSDRLRRLTLDEQSPIVDAVNTHTPIWLTSAEAVTARSPAREGGTGTSASQPWAVLPLGVDGAAVGALVLSFGEPCTLDEAGRGYLVTIAAQCAQAIHRARLLQQTHAASEQVGTYAGRLHALAALSLELGEASLDLRATLAAAAEWIARITGDFTFITQLTPDGAWLEPVAHAQPPDVSIDPTLVGDVALMGRQRRGEGLAAAVTSSQSAFRLTDLERGTPGSLIQPEIIPLLQRLDVDSALLAPLRVRGRAVGSLVLLRPRARGRHSADDEHFGQDLADRAALAIDNARLYHEAKRATEIRDEFLSIAAHELKTPVTSLRGFAQFAVRQIDRDKPLGPEALRRTFQIIDQQSDKLARLIAQLMDASRIESGQLALNRTRTDLIALVHSTVAYTQTRTRQSIQVRTPGAAYATIDPMRIEQVLTNLLDNAIKFSPEDGRILVELTTEGVAAVRLTVADSGIGIPPERRDHLFDRFYHAFAGSPAAGFGLGLYICRRIVDLHGGGLAAEFPASGGSRFSVVLPLSDGQAINSEGTR